MGTSETPGESQFWDEVRELHEALTQEELIALYKMCDNALVRQNLRFAAMHDFTPSRLELYKHLCALEHQRRNGA